MSTLEEQLEAAAIPGLLRVPVPSDIGALQDRVARLERILNALIFDEELGKALKGPLRMAIAAIRGTTKGDIIVFNGTDHTRLAVGANTQVLTADSAEASGIKWA